MELNNQNLYINNSTIKPISNKVVQQHNKIDFVLPQSNPINAQTANILKTNALSKPNINYKDLGIVKLPNLQPARLYQLNTGQKVVIVPKKGPTVLRTFVKVGSFNEPDSIRGLSHYIEHNLFNGSDHLAKGEFVKTVNNMGASYNASTGFLATDYYIKSPLHKPDDLQKIITMHADMVNNPTYSEDMLLKEKGPVISEIQMLGDNPYNIANNEVIKNLFNIKTTSFDLIGGTVDNIQNLNREKVVEYYDKWYTPDNMTTVLVGDVNPDKVIGKISQEFSKGINTNQLTDTKYYEPIIPIAKPVRVDKKNPTTNSTIVNMGFSGPKNNDTKSLVALEGLILALAGSKYSNLSKELKPLNVAPFIDYEPVSPKLDDPVAILLSADFKPGDEEAGLKTIYSVIHKMSYEPISNEMLNTIKTKLKSSLNNVAESSMGITSAIGHSIVSHGDIKAYSEREKNINELTVDDIKNAAKQYLDLNKTSICVIHPENQQINTQPAQKIAFKGKASNGKTISFAGSNAKPYIGEIKEYKLSNNMHVFLHDTPESNKVAANFEFKLNNFAKTKPGTVAILRKMLDYGTLKHNEMEFSKLLDKDNIDLLAYCTPKSINIDFVADKDKLPLTLDYLKETLLNPAFSQENIERAKSELKKSIETATKSVYEPVNKELYGANDPRGYTRNDILANMDKITLQDIQHLYSQIINNSDARAVISAPISKDSQIQNTIFSKLQKDIPNFKEYTNINNVKKVDIKKPLVLTQIENKNQANISQEFHMNLTGNVKDIAALKLLNEILGGNSKSRLFSDLRETQKLAYSVRSSLNLSKQSADLRMSIGTTTENGANGNQFENVQKSLDGFKKHINNFINTTVSAKELEGAKLKLTSKLVYNTESQLGKTIAIDSSLNSLYGTQYNDKLIEAINNTSAGDIQRIAKHYLTKPSIISMIASKNTLEANKDYLATLGEVKAY